MSKPLRIADAVVDRDVPSIAAYHRAKSEDKARRILAEYDRIIALLAFNPLILAERSHGWRVYPFHAGAYLLYYKELDALWLVAGIFHALRDPDWIQAQLVIREASPVPS